MPGLLARFFAIADRTNRTIIASIDCFTHRCTITIPKTSVNLSQKGSVHYLSLLLLAFFSLAMIILVAVMQSGNVGDLRSRAWSGMTANVSEFQSRLRQVKTSAQMLPKWARSQDLYWQLHTLYEQIDVQDIDLPALAIRGKAQMKYDPVIGKTFVFVRIENLSYLEGRILRVWLTDGLRFLPAGVFEFVSEKGIVVGYSVFSWEGNLKDHFRELTISYEQSMQGDFPGVAILRLRF